MKPRDAPCRLDTKVEAAETVLPKPKTPKAIISTPQTITRCRSGGSYGFLLFICRRNQRTTVGRDGRRTSGMHRQTNRRSDRRTNKRVFRQTDERTLQRLSRPTAQRWLVATLGHWAVGRNIRPHIWLYGEPTIETDVHILNRCGFQN